MPVTHPFKSTTVEQCTASEAPSLSPTKKAQSGFAVKISHSKQKLRKWVLIQLPCTSNLEFLKHLFLQVREQLLFHQKKNELIHLWAILFLPRNIFWNTKTYHLCELHDAVFFRSHQTLNRTTSTVSQKNVQALNIAWSAVVSWRISSTKSRWKLVHFVVDLLYAWSESPKSTGSTQKALGAKVLLVQGLGLSFQKKKRG